MGKIETATQWMIDLANDDSHGYDQDSRWGPDYDCSSSVISAWQYAGVPVKTKGASSTYDMKNVFLSCGFTNVISSVNVSTGAGLKRGDVLHRSGHTAMYIGNNKQVAAHLNEKGTTKGGKTGDQTGKEISVSAYSNSSSNPSLLHSCNISFFPETKTKPVASPAWHLPCPMYIVFLHRIRSVDSSSQLFSQSFSFLHLCIRGLIPTMFFP